MMLVLHNVRMKSSNVRKKNGTIKCDKSTVQCDIGAVELDNGTIKCEGKKKKEPPNVTKKQLHIMLELHNVRIESSNMRKK